VGPEASIPMPATVYKTGLVDETGPHWFALKNRHQVGFIASIRMPVRFIKLVWLTKQVPTCLLSKIGAYKCGT
jgi:hypothetical protein